MNVVDRRRRLPPSNAFPLVFDSLTNESEIETKKSNLFVNLSHIPTAIGSCYLQSNQTIISASVYGPRPSFTKTFNSQAQLKITIHQNPFLKLDEIINKSTISSTLETSSTNLILLNQYPKSNIDIFVNIISVGNDISDIDFLALIHNTVNMAIVDSGIGIKNSPSCGVAISENGTKVLVNTIHSNNYTNDSIENIDNEELLVLYCPSLSNDEDFKQLFNLAIQDARKLRLELSQLYLNSL